MLNNKRENISSRTKFFVFQDRVAVEKVADHGPVSNKQRKTYDNKAMLYGQFVKVEYSQGYIRRGVFI